MKKSYSLLVILLTWHGVFAQKQPKKNLENIPVAQEIAPTSASERLAGFEERKKMEAASLVKNIAFRNVGPTVMGGRVVDIEVNPANTNEFYVAYASGGLWKTENNGNSFVPIFDNEAVMTIGDVAVDWRTQTLWVGTGENNSSRSSYAGVGIYKSTDNGKTWQHLPGLDDTHHIGALVLHPTDANVAWVAAVGHLYSANAQRGIFKTTDGGKTWKNTLFIDTQTGAIALKADPTNPQILYAATWHKQRRAWNFVEGGGTSGIHKSTDGGQTWQLISATGSGFPQGEGVGRIGLAIYDKNPQIVYAIVDNSNAKSKKNDSPEANKLSKAQLERLSKDDFLKLTDATLNEYVETNGFADKYTAKKLKEMVADGKITPLDVLNHTDDANSRLFSKPIVGAELYRSENGGQTWQRTTNEPLESLHYTYGYYFGQVWVAPQNDKKVVIAGVPMLKSEDAGKTWRSMDGDDMQGNVHADHHACWFDPANANHFIIGNDGGINITYDNGATWAKANTPAVGQFYYVNTDNAKPYNIYGGLQDNGVWVGPSTYRAGYGWYGRGQYPYKMLLGGDGMQVQIDPRDNATVYTGFQFGNYFRINKTTGETRALVVPEELGEAKLRWNWMSPILISKHNPDIIYFASNRFHRSMNKGDDFKTLSADLTNGPKQGDVAFGTVTTIDESALKFGLLYAGTDDGLLQMSQDGGYNWSNVSAGLPKNLWIVRVVASNHQEGTVYVALNGYRDDHFKAYVFASTNYGKTWRSISANLPDEPVNVVKEDPKNADIIYIGTDHGLYVSLNRGTSYQKMSNGLPAVAVHDVVVHPRDNELVVGTHGRSIYVGNVEHLQQMTDSLLAKEMHWFAPKSTTASLAWGRLRDKYRKAPEWKTEFAYYTKTAGNVTAKILTNNNLALKTWSTTANAGLNYLTYDFSVDTTVARDYEKYLNESRKKDEREIVLKIADDQKMYIAPGTYKLVLENSSGTKTTVAFEVKAPERRPRRMVAFASPDDLEEWREENEEEEKK